MTGPVGLKELRRGNVSPDGLASRLSHRRATLCRLKLHLPRPSHFDLSAVVTSHGWYRLAPFAWDDAERVLRHVDLYDETVVAVEVRQAEKRLTITASAPVDPRELERRIRRMLQIDVDLTDFYRLCARFRDLETVPARHLGRLLCAPTLFEDAVKIILTTNTRWSRTVEMTRLLVAHFGREEGGLTAFPTAADLATGSELDIRETARVGYRARLIHQLAVRLASGEIDLATRPHPSSASYQAAYEWYLRLPGIGPYGAAHLMAMDGRHDRIAVDTEFRAWARNKYHGGRVVKDRTLLRHYRRWGRWQYIAYWCELMLG